MFGVTGSRKHPCDGQPPENFRLPGNICVLESCRAVRVGPSQAISTGISLNQTYDSIGRAILGRINADRLKTAVQTADLSTRSATLEQLHFADNVNESLSYGQQPES
jgi:hypothetical protein